MDGIINYLDYAFGMTSASAYLCPDDDDYFPAARTASPKPDNDNQKPANGSIVVNGVVLPQAVADQLRMLGLSLSWYSAGELQAAVQDCVVDENLIKDPNGLNFMDDLIVDDYDMFIDPDDDDDTNYSRLNLIHPGHANIFGELDDSTRSPFYDPNHHDRLKWERERRKRAVASGSDDNGDSEAIRH
jgi:hypothetical protein